MVVTVDRPVAMKTPAEVDVAPVDPVEPVEPVEEPLAWPGTRVASENPSMAMAVRVAVRSRFESDTHTSFGAAI